MPKSQRPSGFRRVGDGASLVGERSSDPLLLPMKKLFHGPQGDGVGDLGHRARQRRDRLGLAPPAAANASRRDALFDGVCKHAFNPAPHSGSFPARSVVRGRLVATRVSVPTDILKSDLSTEVRVDRSEQAKQVAHRLGVVAHPSAAHLAEAVALFAPLGWAMCERWHMEGTLRALRLAAEGAESAELDEVITDVWNNDNQMWLQHAAAPIRRWSNSHYPFKQVLWDRVGLIEKAIAHHQAGAYGASIPIILAQIDGMSRDLTGQSFFSKANNDPYLDDATLAGMETNLPIVRGVFSHDVTESGSYGLVSRHGVLHGRDLAYATRVNSTKTIVLVAALAEYFPRVADDAGARLRRHHEEQVAGRQAVDELGRIVDDRHVPEVHQFAWDFDIAYSKNLLLRKGAFHASAVGASIAQEVGLDPSVFTLGQDATGCWWHNALPAGQVLGYAARPSTSTERRHPDVWRWDDPQAPSSPPWQSPTRWRSDDEFPRSPNWEPKVIMGSGLPEG